MNINTAHENISEEFVDPAIENQANDDSAWESSIQVDHSSLLLEIPSELASQAKFLANLEKEQDVTVWLVSFIREHLNIKLESHLKKLFN